MRGWGIRTGHIVGIDIDVIDPEVAHRMGRIVEERTGASLVRVGLGPKRLYLVRQRSPSPRSLSASWKFSVSDSSS